MKLSAIMPVYNEKNALSKIITMEKALQNLNIMAQAKHYNRWIFEMVNPYIGKRVLEIGCGIGNMTQFFIDKELVISIDSSEEGLRYVKNKFFDKKNFHAFNYDISDDRVLEIKKYKFDTAICINLLEHIEDDVKALSNMYQVLEPEGRLILIVPAFPILYGSIDKVDGHFRRYNKKGLQNKLKKCGFSVQKSLYMDIFGILLWILHGKILKKKIHPKGQIVFFDKFVPFCAFWEKVIRPPFGLSLFFICERVTNA